MTAAAPELLDAAIRLLATFDELKATTQVERIITGQSMTDLRRRSEQAIADLRAAVAIAKAEAV